jgi:hypothetical protein
MLAKPDKRGVSFNLIGFLFFASQFFIFFCYVHILNIIAPCGTSNKNNNYMMMGKKKKEETKWDEIDVIIMLDCFSPRIIGFKLFMKSKHNYCKVRFDF